jgi:putative membrane protein
MSEMGESQPDQQDAQLAQDSAHSDQSPLPAGPPESPQVRLIVTALSGLVFLLVAIVIYMLPNRGGANGPSALATLNAFLNSCATLCLIAGFILIRRKNIRWHRRAMLSAFGISSMFLLTYLLHHAQVGSVPFRGQGPIRIVYFSLLIPHIILSAAVVPMALLTIYRGWTDRIEHHRRIARITFPIWLFVSLSGVSVYYMLYHMGH